MMRRRTTQAAVTALALAASASMVHAGGGGAGGIAGTSLFDCYLINGADAPHVLTMDDQFYPDGRTGVKLGKAKLLCTPAGAIVTSGTLNPGDFSNADHIKCYEAPPGGANPKVKFQVLDPFVAETVKIGVPQFVCVGAFKCPVGQTCPPE